MRAIQSPSKAPIRRRFSILPTIDGFQVIDDDGRPVDTRPTAQSANGSAFVFNEAAKSGPRALAKALRAA